MGRRVRWILVGAAAAWAGCGARTDLETVERGELETTSASSTSSATWTSTSSTTTTTTGPIGPTAICPGTIDTTPLTQVTVAGNATDDGVIVDWLWELVQGPPGSSAAEPMPAYAPTTFFTPDVAGEYVLVLTVTDDDGFRASCETLVRAIPDETFRVELYWNPPEDPADVSDVDLHLLHPAAPGWFDTTFDCFYMNCSVAAGMVLEWDVPAYSYDNPQLDLDDVDGFGPENINIVAPIIGQIYTVGVHYYDAESTGPADAYVRIYCGEDAIDPIYEAGPTELVGDQDSMSNEFWKVATLVWNGTGCEVTPIDTIVSAEEASMHP